MVSNLSNYLIRIFRYCTGGIRCEMASAYIRSKGEGFENVFQVSCTFRLLILRFQTSVHIHHDIILCISYESFLIVLALVIRWHSEIFGAISRWWLF